MAILINYGRFEPSEDLHCVCMCDHIDWTLTMFIACFALPTGSCGQ